MATLPWIKNLLDRRGISYEEVHHTEAFTAQEVAQREHTSGHRMAKVVVVIADERPVELVLPASRRIVMDRVRETLGVREARLATEDELQKYFTDCEVGAVPPLPHWKDVPVYMDAAMQVKGNILFQGGTHRDAVRLDFEDWFKLVRPAVAAFSEPEELFHQKTFAGREA